MATMKAWQFQASSDSFTQNLTHRSSLPRPTIRPNEVLVKNYATALNAIDFKPLELGLITRLAFGKPSTPGLDICGQVIETGSSVTDYAVGDIVYGALAPPVPSNGSLAEHVPVPVSNIAKVPASLQNDAEKMVAVGIVGLASYAALKPYVKKGDKVFINGGSGGTGVMAIQIAKILGAEVTTSSSKVNLELCKSLGADLALDYTEAPIVQQLKDRSLVFDLIVDNAGSPIDLYRSSAPFLKPEGKFIQVAASMSPSGILNMARNKLASVFSWGKWEWIFVDFEKGQSEAYAQLAEWVEEGKLKAVVDSRYAFEEVKEAYERLRTGRARGRVVVKI